MATSSDGSCSSQSGTTGSTPCGIVRLPDEILIIIERLLVESDEKKEDDGGSVRSQDDDDDDDNAGDSENREEDADGEDEDDEDDSDSEPNGDEDDDQEDEPYRDEEKRDSACDPKAEERAENRRRENEINLISILCLALTCKRFWQLFGGTRRVRRAKALHCPANWSPGKFIPSSATVLKSKWWSLLERIEDHRWRCCAGCFVLHPVREFETSQLSVQADSRTCIFGPLVGVVDFCPCFRMTFRTKAKLVRSMMLDPETEQPRLDIPEDTTRTMPLHECYAERWSNHPDGGRTNRLRLDSPVYKKLSQNKMERFEENYTHGSAFTSALCDPLDSSCYACDCKDGQRVDRQFSAVLDSDGYLSVVTEVDVTSYWHKAEDYNYSWTPLYGQLARHPVPICPHRTLYRFTSLMYGAVCNPEGDCYDWHSVEEDTAPKSVLPLLSCKFCDTRVEEFVTKRENGLGPCHVYVRTVRNLGRALDFADEAWFAQTAFCSEGLDAEEQKKRSPWHGRP
ncbi:uncharacterized protein BJX67DRAFT_31837 [Aspergillus lucknowensis]|uniref:F-box domain-containing protein n=1 Tax=Aspergillus lucknowensis TaxID=176173 RepID=A0ABR4LWY4_9EURO